MAVDASIPLGFQMPKLMSPMDAQGQALNLRDLQMQTQMRQQQMQQGQQTLRDQQELSRIASDRSNIDPATGGLTAEALTKLTNPMLRQKLNQDRMATMLKSKEIEYKESEAGKLADERKTKALHDVMENAYAAYEDVLKKTGDPKIATEASEKVQRDGFDDIKKTGRGGFSSETQFKVMAPEDIGRKLISHKERTEEEARKEASDRAKETPFVKETNYLKSLESKLADLAPTDPAAGAMRKQIAEVKAHIAKLDAPARTTVNMNGGKPTMDGDALDLAANQLLINGSMPAGFSRNQANVGAIYKRAAELAKAKGQTNEAALFNSKSIKSDQTSLTNLTKQADMITSFESTAKKNLDMLVDQSRKVPRTSFPLLNKALLTGKLETGDPEVAKLHAIVKPFVDEYAKILSGQTGSAGASDTARREAAGIIAGYMAPGQIEALAPFIRQELSNRTSSLDEQREVIKARMSGKPKDAAPAPAAPGAKPSAPSAADMAAVTWAKANPNDPRAKKIMEHNNGI